MVEQSKRFRRGMRQRPAKAPEEAPVDPPVEASVEVPAEVTETVPVQRRGLLSGSGRSAEEIAREDRALRSAFPFLDLDDVEVDASELAEKVAPVAAPEPLILNPESEVTPEPETEQPSEQPPEDDGWNDLGPMPVQRQQMMRNLIITASRKNPVHAAFDVLRARLVQALSDNGWRRVAITSPTRDCGKTFVSVNLAVALSRYENCRTVLMDMDMRNPSVAKTLGLRDVGSMGAYLRGEIETRDQFFKFDQNDMSLGDNLAIAMNDRVEPFASELMQQPATRDRLTRMEAELHPDVVLFDLPPALANDDVITFKSNFDGVLIVIDGTRTSGAEVREVMRRLGEDVPLLGVVLNKAEDATGDEYGY